MTSTWPSPARPGGVWRVGSGYSCSTGAIAGFTPTFTPLMMPFRAFLSGTVIVCVWPIFWRRPS